MHPILLRLHPGNVEVRRTFTARVKMIPLFNAQDVRRQCPTFMLSKGYIMLLPSFNPLSHLR